MKEDKWSTAFQTNGKILTKSDIPNDNLRTTYREKTSFLVSNPGDKSYRRKLNIQRLTKGS